MLPRLLCPLTRCQWRDIILGFRAHVSFISADGFGSTPAVIARSVFFRHVTISSLSPQCFKTDLTHSDVISRFCSGDRTGCTVQELALFNLPGSGYTSHIGNRFSGTTEEDSNGDDNSRKFYPLLLAFTFPWAKKPDDDEKVDPIVMTLKRGVLATHKQSFEEAQELFHQALELGNQQHKQQNIDDSQHLIMKVNIFGLMADAAMKAADYKNAEKLYKEIMKLCIASGKRSDDPAMVELSIKLASMYAMQSRDDEAEIGFKFCLESTNKAIDKSGGVLEADTNLLALHGLTCQSYARFLMKTKQYNKAIELYTSSLDVAKEVYGSDHPQTLVILNDIASAYVISGKHSEGVRYYKEAVDRASRMKDMEDSMVAFHYNLGEALIITKEFVEAHHHCKKSLQFAKHVNNPMLIQMAKQCLSDVVDVQKKQKK